MMRLRSTLSMLGLAAVGVLALLPSPTQAQQNATRDSAALAAVVEHLDAARFDSARAALTAWQTTHAADARERERTTADMLGARLERDGVAAQHAWLSLALAHPFGSDAGLALLRVGQAAMLQGDTATAVVYLNRLIDDFPGSGHQAEAQLWLSRAHFLARHARPACEAARAGLAVGTSAEVQALLRVQEERACSAQSLAADPPRPAETDRAVGAMPVTAQAAPATGRYAVQAGAFRTRTAADALMDRLRDEGFEPRLVRVAGNDLMRVRVGGYDAQTDAASLRDRVRSAGLEAVVVDDVSTESAVP